MPLKQPEIERRSLGKAEVRAAEGGRTIVGYAAVFNELSEELWGFREIILPGAFDRALEEEHDVRALWNHNSDVVLGRTKSGTLKLAVDEKGLRVEINPPETQAAEDLLASIRRGDVDGMSFGFRTLTDNWRLQDGEQIRELVDLELLDVSPVAYPAYPQTQVSARALEHVREHATPPAPPAVPMSVNKARQRLSEADLPSCAMCGRVLPTAAVIRNGNRFCAGCGLK